MIARQTRAASKKNTIVLSLLLSILSTNCILAQHTSLDLEYRINPTFSSGFRQPLYDGERPGFFTLQRTRLILNYNNPDSLKAKLVLQDRRAWGEVNERADVAEVAIFRAWIEKQIGANFSIKLGRQGLVYDDQYILGELNWGGTLAHDLALGKYEKGKFKAHLGLAFNANRINELKRDLFQPRFYKDMQFLWLHNDWNSVKSSFTFINHGIEQVDTTANHTQTFGTNTSAKISDKVSIKGIYFHQTGKDGIGKDVNASFWSLQLTLKPKNNLALTLGVETVSGTDVGEFNTPGSKSSTYNILYGLRHGHFGYLDYFYLLFDPTFGLQDYYTKFDFSVSKKLSLRNHIHFFSTDAGVYASDDLAYSQQLDPFLGIENDFLISYNWSKDFKASFGHSVMFGTNTLDEVFGGRRSKDNQVLYMVITASPRLFDKK